MKLAMINGARTKRRDCIFDRVDKSRDNIWHARKREDMPFEISISRGNVSLAVD